MKECRSKRKVVKTQECRERAAPASSSGDVHSNLILISEFFYRSWVPSQVEDGNTILWLLAAARSLTTEVP